MLERYDLEVFAAAAKHLNFAAAAKELKITAPQVSKVIAKIEDRIHQTLFIRNTRQMKLSEYGQILLPAAQQTLSSFLDVEQIFEITEQDAQVSGSLRINCAHTLGVKVLAPIVASFQEKYPCIEISVLLSDHYEDLIEQNLDMAVRIFKPDESSLMCRKIGENPLVICASPSYLKRHSPIKTVKDLSAHRLVYIPTHRNVRFRNSNIQFSDLSKHAPIIATNGDFLTQMAVHGAGIVVRSKWSVQKELDSGDLVALSISDELVSETAIYAVYQPNKFMPKRLRIWLDHLYSEFSM